METTRRPSTTWFWIAGVLALAGMVGSIAWGVHTYRLLEARLDALPRVAVPGEVSVDLEEPQGLTIFYEDPGAAGGFGVLWNTLGGPMGGDDGPVDLLVTGPSGEQVPTAPYDGDLRFDVGGNVAIALATFDAPAAGTYTVTATGDVPTAARVSVGQVVDGGLVAQVVGAVVLFVGTVAVTVPLVVVVAYRRSRSPQPA